MRVVISSDTHVPSRADGIPEWVQAEIRGADHVVHAGDFDSVEAYEQVVELSPDLTAVRGNLDPELGLPEVAVLDVEGVRFVVTHGTGDLEGYEDRVAETVAEHADSERLTIGVSGHTHQRMDRELGGYRVLNPGSATGAEPAPDTSILVVEVSDGSVGVTSIVG